MGTVSDKLTYLNGTKQLLKTVINYADAGIDNNTTFRNYAVKLYDAYVEILKDKYVLLDEIPKGTATGTTINVTNAEDLPVYELKASKESTQHTTTGKNKFDYAYVSDYNNTTYNAYRYIKINDYDNTKRYLMSGIDTSVFDNVSGVTIYFFNTTAYSGLISGTSFCSGSNSFNTNKRVIDVGLSTTGDLYLGIYASNGVTQAEYDVIISKLQNVMIEEMASGDTPTTYEEYTNGIASPSPDYQQEVETVKGYRNLFSPNISDYSNVGVYKLRDLGLQDKLLNINFIDKDTSIDISNINIGFSYDTNPNNGFIWSMNNGNINADSSNITTSGTNVGVKASYVMLYPNTEDAFNRLNERYYIQIVEGSETKPYVAYGNNYVKINITNGVDANNLLIPLNNNELVGKSTNLDELIIDKTGHVYINKVFAKIDSYNGETITTDYWSTTGGLDTGATIYYVRTTPELIDLNTTVDVELFKGTNNITNSEGATMNIQYVKDISDIM